MSLHAGSLPAPAANAGVAAGSERSRPLPSRIWFGLSLALVAANLRPAITSLPPLLPEITHTYRLIPATASLLVAVPVLVLGVGSPLGAVLARRLGVSRAIDIGLVLISAGLAMRSISVAAMFPGTIVAALGITTVAVLLPAHIASHDPASMGLWTSTYAVAMALGASLAPALSGWLATLGVPLSVALLLWAVLPVVAVAVRARTPGRPDRVHRAARMGGLWRRLVAQPAALALTGFFLTQALLFFAAVTWLPVYARSRGASAAGAGLTLAAFSGLGMVSALWVPVLAARARSRVPLAATLCGCGAIGFGLLASGAPVVWGVAFLAFGQGGAFPLALVLIPLKSRDPEVATSLSALVQGVGFAGAGAGLGGLALLRSPSGAWPTMWWLLSGVAVTQAVLASFAATSGQVTSAVDRPARQPALDHPEDPS